MQSSVLWSWEKKKVNNKTSRLNKWATRKSSCLHTTVTQLSGSALHVEALLKQPDSVYFTVLLWYPLAVSRAATKDMEISKSPSVDAAPLPSPLASPDSVWHSVGLVAVALAVAGVLWPAGGTLVPPQSHGPVGEHRDAFGNPPEGLGREREQCETKGTRGHFQRSFLTLLRSKEIQTERQREPKRQTLLKGARWRTMKRLHGLNASLGFRRKTEPALLPVPKGSPKYRNYHIECIKWLLQSVHSFHLNPLKTWEIHSFWAKEVPVHFSENGKCLIRTKEQNLNCLIRNKNVSIESSLSNFYFGVNHLTRANWST